MQNIEAVTVLIPPLNNAGTLSDVASKPIFIAKPSARNEAAKAMNVENFLVIESEINIQVSPSMAKRLTWSDKDTAKHVAIIQP